MLYGHHVCGLFYNIPSNNKRTYLPQVKLESHTTINPVCFTTQLTQTFHNPNSESLSQVWYTFPLYDGVAVNGYTISYASKVLKGIVKQKDDAKKTYQAAVDRRETAGLLESLPAGVFGVTLGNVPANTDIVVNITYCGELKHDAAIDGLRYMLPTSIAPRYGNYPGEVLQSNTVAKGGISITVDVDMAGSAIRKVQSPSHPIAVSMGATSMSEGGDQAPFKPSQASATLTLGSTELADDFVLQLLIDDISKPHAILETHPTLPNHCAIMTTLVPKFTLEPVHPEIVFIADQSGSMGGSKNDALVGALKVFLKSLPLGVRFNICAFGSGFKFLWPKSQAYNESNVNTAISFVDSFRANCGGTEILKPIKAAFKQHLSDLPLEVMLLTDGEIWGESGVFDYINEQIRDKGVDARVFALGIGGDVSHTLVEGVARAGNGFAQFVTQNEDTGQKVIRMLKGALYAHTKNYELEVHYDKGEEEQMSDDDDFEIVEKVNGCLNIADKPPVYAEKDKSSGVVAKVKSFFDTSADVDRPMNTDDDSVARYAHLADVETPKLLQAPADIPPLFPFNRTTVYLLLGPDSAQKKVTSVTLRATSAQGPLELNIPVNYSEKRDIPTIHQLAARKAIQDLEEGRGWLQAAKSNDGAMVRKKYESRFDELVERECVRLGEKFQVAGKWTSFVAVEDKDGGGMDLDENKAAVQPSNNYIDKAVTNARMAPRGLSMGYVAPSFVPFPSSNQSGRLFGNARSEHTLSGGLFGNLALAQSGLGRSFGSLDQSSRLFNDLDGEPCPAGGLFGNQISPQGENRKQLAGANQESSTFGVSTPRLFGSQNVVPGNGSRGAGPQSYSGLSFGGFASNTVSNTGGGLYSSHAVGSNTGHVADSVFGPASLATGPYVARPGFPTSTVQSSSFFGFGKATTTKRSPSSHDNSGSESSLPNLPLSPPSKPTLTPASSHTQPSSPQHPLTFDPHSAQSFSVSPADKAKRRSKRAALAAGTDEASSGSEQAEEEAEAAFDTAYDPTIEDSSALDESMLQAMSEQFSSGQSSSVASAGAMAAPASFRRGNRTNQKARSSTGGQPPRKQLASMAARKSAPSSKPVVPLAVEEDDYDEAGFMFESSSNDDANAVAAMHKLIDLQTFSGAWAWEEKLFSILGIDEETVKAKEQDLGPDAECRATALAIAFLENRISGKKDVWEMVVAKARGWLVQQMGDAAKVDEAVRRAGTVF